MATTLLHLQPLPSPATIPRGVYGCSWDRRARSRAGWSNVKQIVCAAGKHPREPRKDFSHLDGTPASAKKAPKTVKKSKSAGLPVWITVNRSDSKWSDSWNTEQATTLKDLHLEDISTDSGFQGPGKPPKDLVHVDLAVQKSGWGFFVQAQVRSTVLQQCSRCFKKYPAPLSGSFQAWLTPTQDMFVHPQGKCEENGDPTVVYFPLGEEVADLTGMVRDTIRLCYTPKAICSEECDKLGPRTWEVGGGSERRVVDSPWLPLLKVKENLSDMEAPQVDYYARLGLQHDATTSDIRKAYLHASRATHPDKKKQSMGENASCLDFLQVQEAYKVLVDVEKRKSYDEMVSRSKHLLAKTNPSNVQNYKKCNPSNHKAEMNIQDGQHQKDQSNTFKGLVVGPNVGKVKTQDEKHHLVGTRNGLKASDGSSNNHHKSNSSMGSFGFEVGPGRR